MTSWCASAGILCPIGLYRKHEGEIARLTDAIKRSSSAGEMARAAHDMRHHVSALLNCRAHDEHDVNCRMRRDLSTLREKTAGVVEQMTALSP